MQVREVGIIKTLVVDAMGGDNAPEAIVEGLLEAMAQDQDFRALLVGPQEKLNALLASASEIAKRIEIIPASQVIDPHEAPVLAIRQKADSSLVKSFLLLKEGKADGLVTAAPTGAVLAGGMFRLGRLPGIDRPAIATLLPTVKGKPMLLLDVGANVDCKPEWIAQFALMGQAYMRCVEGVKEPRFALLNIGEEAEKGNQLSKDAHACVKDLPGFAGNLEPRAFFSGDVDVVATDGFFGNVALKAMEGTSLAIFSFLKQELNASFFTKIGGLLAKPAFRRVKRRMDPDEIGGAPLLGLTHAVIKAHGNSTAHAFASAVAQTLRAVRGDVAGAITTALSGEH